MADTPETRPPGVTSGDRTGLQSGQVGAEARQQATRLADEAKQRGKTLLDHQKGNAAKQLSGIASALRQTASRCAEQPDQRVAGRTLEQAAAGLDRFAEALRQRDVGGLIDQATDLVRRQPAVFIGGTIAAGFLLSRFARSSASRQHGSRDYADYRSDWRDEASSYGTGEEIDSGAAAGEGRPYVTGAHVDPGEVSRGYVPPVTPTGRRDY